MPKPIYNVPAKISLTAERFNKSSDEYLSSKYDVANYCRAAATRNPGIWSNKG